MERDKLKDRERAELKKEGKNVDEEAPKKKVNLTQF
jgi:hypothetical protein